jgi:hypothetical protein
MLRALFWGVVTGSNVSDFGWGSPAWIWRGATLKFLNVPKVVPFDALALGLAVKVLSKSRCEHWIASK